MKRKATPPADGVLKSLGHLVQKADGEAAKPVFRITSEVLDRHRDRVKPGSLKTENFEKNPVLLWNHQDWEPAIGTCRLFQEGGEWLMEPAFDGIGERSKDVAAKVAAGTLRTCSIRFRYLKYAYNEEGGLDYEEVELLEVSITNIPANPEALRVKNQSQQQTNKNNTPPAEGESFKALEQVDLDAIRALVDEAMAPVLETLKSIETTLATLSKGKAADPGEGEGSAEEMTDEEAEEMKAFFSGLATSKK